MLEAFPDAIFHTLPPYPAPFPEKPAVLAQTYTGHFTHMYLLQALHKARLIKTPEEILLIRIANEISSRAHEVSLVLVLLRYGIYVLGCYAAAWERSQRTRAQRAGGETSTTRGMAHPKGSRGRGGFRS